MLESINNGKINIKDLVLKEEGKQDNSIFDPKKLVTEEMWQETIASLSEKGHSQDEFRRGIRAGDLYILIESLAFVKLFHPKTPPEFDLTDSEFEAFKQECGDILPYSHTLSYLKITFKERFDEFDLNYDKVWDMLSSDDRNPNIYDFLSLKIMFPNEFPKNLPGEDLWERDIKALKSLEDKRNTEGLRDYVELASSLKILFPEKFRSYQIPTEMKHSLSKIFEEKEDDDLSGWGSFSADTVFCLAVLSADKVNITEDGITFENRISDEDDIPKLPEGRKF